MRFAYTQPISTFLPDVGYTSFPVLAYKSTQTYDSVCAPALGIPTISVTKSAFSFSSQADADQQALTAAMTLAIAQRQQNPCGPSSLPAPDVVEPGPLPPTPPVTSGIVFFADMNWLVTIDTADNRSACLALFNIFFGGQKELCTLDYSAINVESTASPYYEEGLIYAPWYEGLPDPETYCPVMHEALDPEGYTFTPIDLTVPGASLSVTAPFVVPLYYPDDNFVETVQENLRELSTRVPVLIFGEWNDWEGYDNEILQFMGYSPEEVSYDQSLAATDSLVNPANSLGLLLQNSGVSGFDHDATGTFSGTEALPNAFATADGEPSMLALPAKPV